jgi:hypothetical protein
MAAELTLMRLPSIATTMAAAQHKQSKPQGDKAIWAKTITI